MFHMFHYNIKPGSSTLIDTTATPRSLGVSKGSDSVAARIRVESGTPHVPAISCRFGTRRA